MLRGSPGDGVIVLRFIHHSKHKRSITSPTQTIIKVPLLPLIKSPRSRLTPTILLLTLAIDVSYTILAALCSCCFTSPGIATVASLRRLAILIVAVRGWSRGKRYHRHHPMDYHRVQSPPSCPMTGLLDKGKGSRAQRCSNAHRIGLQRRVIIYE